MSYDAVAGVFMAKHFDRLYCGKCYNTLVHSDKGGEKSQEGGKKGKK